MITSLSELLLTDTIFERGADNRYKLGTENEFIPDSDINGTLDYIADCIHENLKKITLRKPFLNQCEVKIDYVALKQVLTKYSRDVFGQRRLLAILKSIPNYGAHLNNMEIFGMKTNSFNPYLHRRAGCFMYWCCTLKPFHIITNEDGLTIPENDRNLMNTFNEFIAYMLVKLMLISCSILRHCNLDECKYKKAGLLDDDCFLAINIADDEFLFKDFLYDVHFRSLSRSSFELFMSRFCIIPQCKKGICPLTNIDLQKRNLKFIDEFKVDK
jgi:hypothetical protein